MLGFILARRNLSVLALQHELAAAGLAVNIKSLYRLANDTPVQKIDLHIAAAICKVCEVGLSDLISFRKPKAQLHRLDSKTEARLDALMSKNNEGRLTPAERREFGTLADRAHQISLANARTLLAEQRRVGKSAPAKGKTGARKHTPIAA
ncbi:MAG: hypothetical protein WDN28_11295 [Chthoniobacter sp.]